MCGIRFGYSMQTRCVLRSELPRLGPSCHVCQCLGPSCHICQCLLSPLHLTAGAKPQCWRAGSLWPGAGHIAATPPLHTLDALRASQHSANALCRLAARDVEEVLEGILSHDKDLPEVVLSPMTQHPVLNVSRTSKPHALPRFSGFTLRPASTVQPSLQ